MNEAKRAVPFDEVMEFERRDLETRRERAGLPRSLEDQAPVRGEVLAGSAAGEGQETAPCAGPSNVTGLALSGGGIRSGALSLGFMQGLYQGRVLRQFDYLSTVSGGGYAGGYLSAMLEEIPADQPIDWQDGTSPEGGGAAATGTSKARRLSFAMHPSGRQPRDVRRMIHSGIYLRNLGELLNSALLGVLVNWVIILSGLTAVMTLVAMAYRALDWQPIMQFLHAIGFLGDVRRAFFPSAVLFGAWSFAHFFRMWRQRERQTSRVSRLASVLAVLLLASLAFGGVLVLTTGDVDLPIQRLTHGKAPEHEAVRSIQNSLSVALLIALLSLLAPYLWRTDLLRSGVRPSRSWHPILVRLASLAMLVGVPLLVFSFVSQENLFGVNERRADRDHLHRLHVKDWPKFWSQVRKEAISPVPGSPSRVLWAAALDFERIHVDLPQIASAADATASRESAIMDYLVRLDAAALDDIYAASPLNKLLYIESQFNERAVSPGWPHWLQVLATPLQGRDNLALVDFSQRLYVIEQKDRLVANLNTRVLDNPHFYKEFSLTNEELEPAIRNARSLAVLADSARWRQSARHQERLLSEAEEERASASAVRSADVPPTNSEMDQLLAVAADRALLREVRKVNRELLHLHYGDAFLHRPEVPFAAILLGEDQKHRLWIFLVSAGIFLTLGFFIDINKTSVHQYYRDRLAELWVYRRTRSDAEVLASKLENTEHGGPYHLINGTVNLLGPNREMHLEPTDMFLFSRRFCGSRRLDFEATHTFAENRTTLADAMAISGAAVSPVAVVNNPLLFYSMLLINARLGQWAPNPGLTERSQPTFIRAIWSYFTGTPEESSYVYVSDGGQHDNTAIEPLLQRRCRVIVACDASHDPDGQFLDFLRLKRRATVFDGIQLEPVDGWPSDLRELTPDIESRRALRHFVIFRIRYPEDQRRNLPASVGYLIYVKPTLDGDEPPEVALYPLENRQFPHDPTLDQFFEPRRFECYRALGAHLGETLCEFLNPPQGEGAATLWLSQLQEPPAAAPVRVGIAENEAEAEAKERAAD